MENQINNAPVSSSAPAMVTAPVAQAVPMTAAPAMTATPQVGVPMNDGGFVNTTGGTTGFFKNINWVEIGFAILGVASLCYVIYYYRFKVRQDKMVNNELQKQIDELKMNVRVQ